MAVAEATLALAAVQTAGGIIGGRSAKRSAKKAARRQAQFTSLQRGEERRQQDIAFKMALGEARLASFASGLQMQGSTKQYISMLESERARQLDYLQKANLAEQQAIMAGAAGAGTGALLQGILAGAGTALTAYEQHQLDKPKAEGG